LIKRNNLSLESILSYLLAFLCVFPFFLSLDRGRIILYPGLFSTKPQLTLPVSVIIIVLLTVLIALKYLNNYVRLSQMRSRLSVPIWLYIYASAIALLFGLIRYFSVNAILFFLQSISPPLIIFIGIYLARKQRAKQYAFTFILGGAVTCWGLIIQSVISRGVADTIRLPMIDHIGPFYIWGLRDYFPLVLAYVSILGLALFYQRQLGWKMFVLIILPTIFVLPLVWSKGAVATFLVALLLLLLFTLFKRQLNARILLTFALLTLGILLLFLSPVQTIFVQRILSDFETQNVKSLESRQDRWQYAFTKTLQRPFTGIGFVPELDSEDLASGSSSPRVFLSHNQYIDIAFKAGLLGMLPFFILLVSILKSLYYFFRKSNMRFEIGLVTGVMAGLIAILFVSNMFQINFSQPYTGIIIWMSLGLVEGQFASNV